MILIFAVQGLMEGNSCLLRDETVAKLEYSVLLGGVGEREDDVGVGKGKGGGEGGGKG